MRPDQSLGFEVVRGGPISALPYSYPTGENGNILVSAKLVPSKPIRIGHGHDLNKGMDIMFDAHDFKHNSMLVWLAFGISDPVYDASKMLAIWHLRHSAVQVRE
jgi:hypothetical protein